MFFNPANLQIQTSLYSFFGVIMAIMATRRSSLPDDGYSPVYVFVIPANGPQVNASALWICTSFCYFKSNMRSIVDIVQTRKIT